MNQGFDIIKNKDFLSIIDLDKNVDLSDSKWETFFDVLIKRTSNIYFSGWHLDYSFKKEIESNLMEFINNIAEEIYVDRDNHNIILFKIKDIYLENRNYINKIWLCYDYPKIIFLKYESDIAQLISNSNQIPSEMQNITTILSGTYMIHKGRQEDTLRISASNDMDIPWQTERNIIELEREQNKPWYERLLNSLGFSYTIDIKRHLDT